jgi:uncharacterized protein YdeI (YjbR/CyaY-like superfamily)
LGERKAVLPEDMRHVLEIRWEARLAFDLLAPDSKQECLRWIENATTLQSRQRRIDSVLDSLKADPAKVAHRATGLSLPRWRASATTTVAGRP